MAKKERSAAGTPAMVALERAGVDYAVHVYEHSPGATRGHRSPAYGEEAARLLGVDPARVHKTLCVDVDGRLVVAVVAVVASLDLKSVAAAVGGKRAHLADPAVAERATGYVRGGIAPVGQRRAHPTVLDDGAWAWPTVFVSGGRRGLEVELAPDDLQRVTGATRAAVARRAPH